jgi:BMFP domain-containing protein YqiC
MGPKLSITGSICGKGSDMNHSLIDTTYLDTLKLMPQTIRKYKIMKKPQADSLRDLLKLGESALSIILGAGQELGTAARSKRDIWVEKMDLVTRDEFETAFTMLKKIRLKQEEIEKRLTKIEAKKTLSSPSKPAGKKQIRAKK